MKKCVICKAPVKTELLCNGCAGDPFKVEDFRAFLAKKKRLEDLNKTYKKSFAQIKDINTPEFWDRVLLKNEKEERKSRITKERIKAVTRMISGLSGKLLDVGFGYGFIEELLSKGNSFTFYGIDISQTAVKRLKKKIIGDFGVGSILKIPYKDNFFDVVLALEILEHISPYNTLKAINELYRVLKAHGALIISVPLNEDLKKMYKSGINPNGHVRVYTPELIEAELKIAGFKIQQEEYLFAFRDFFWLKNQLRRALLKGRWQPNNIVVLVEK